MIPDTATLDVGHFAVMVTAEFVVVGLLAILAVGCALWLYDFVRSLFR